MTVSINVLYIAHYSRQHLNFSHMCCTCTSHTVTKRVDKTDKDVVDVKAGLAEGTV